VRGGTGCVWMGEWGDGWGRMQDMANMCGGTLGVSIIPLGAFTRTIDCSQLHIPPPSHPFPPVCPPPLSCPCLPTHPRPLPCPCLLPAPAPPPPAHLLGASRGGCLGVEEQHQGLTLETCQGHCLAPAGLQHPGVCGVCAGCAVCVSGVGGGGGWGGWGGGWGGGGGAGRMQAGEKGGIAPGLIGRSVT
jgi:hypothetical protein